MPSAPQKANAPSRLVRILPAEIEFDPKDKAGRKVLSTRRWEADKFGRFFPSTLTAKQLHDVVSKTKLKLANLALNDEGDSIIYHYKGRPLIYMNRKDGQFYSPTSEVDQFGKEAVENQAHIVVELLKTHGLSGATLGRPVHSSSARSVLGNLRTYK